MATTSRPISELAIGIRDTAGAVVASGKARFYQPGTLTEQTVYSDDVCTSAITQPQTLNAGGQATVYCLEAVRMIVKNSAETVTYYDGIVNLNRHDAVYITHASINSGTETTLESFLTTATTALGANFQYKESSGATARTYTARLGEHMVSVVDFGATGDGTTDDTTAIQAAIDRVEARGGGWVYLPKGTYKITAALSIDTAGVNIRGAGRGVAVIKNFATGDNALAVNLGSAVDAKITLCDFSVTANTTSNSSGIAVVNGNRIVIQRINVALHRRGIHTSAVTAAKVEDCLIESTDDNAAAIGISAGIRGRVVDCEVISGTDNGTGVSMAGVDGEVRGCYTSNFATGVSLAGARSRALHCNVVGATTGFSLGASNTACQDCYADANTNGYSVGAFDSCRVSGSEAANNVTTALTVNSGATLFHEYGNNWTGTVTNAADTPRSLPLRLNAYSPAADTTASFTFTPLYSQTRIVQVCGNSHTAGAVALTVGATDTAVLAEGDVMILVIYKDGAQNMSITWNAQYLSEKGGAMSTPTACNSNLQLVVWFRWDGTGWRRILQSSASASSGYAV